MGVLSPALGCAGGPATLQGVLAQRVLIPSVPWLKPRHFPALLSSCCSPAAIPGPPQQRDWQHPGSKPKPTPWLMAAEVDGENLATRMLQWCQHCGQRQLGRGSGQQPRGWSIVRRGDTQECGDCSPISSGPRGCRCDAVGCRRVTALKCGSAERVCWCVGLLGGRTSPGVPSPSADITQIHRQLPSSTGQLGL